VNNLATTHLVLVTVPIQTVDGVPGSQNLIRALVTERLAACINRIPGIVSTYLWENELHEDDEELLLIKTSQRQLKKLLVRIEELHPYDVPEVLVFNIDDGLPAYLQWVGEQCVGKQ
jgi:periplasmic divalent cation tolerance protein